MIRIRKLGHLAKPPGKNGPTHGAALFFDCLDLGAPFAAEVKGSRSPGFSLVGLTMGGDLKQQDLLPAAEGALPLGRTVAVALHRSQVSMGAVCN